jgi:hypothetical protein
MFSVTPVTSLVSLARCFEAMTVNSTSVGFLEPLLGRKAPECQLDRTAAEKQIPEQETPSSIFNLPSLNETQEKAAIQFLTSKQNSIKLVQGPPGTVSTIEIHCFSARIDVSLNPIFEGQDKAAAVHYLSMLGVRGPKF